MEGRSEALVPLQPQHPARLLDILAEGEINRALITWVVLIVVAGCTSTASPVATSPPSPSASTLPRASASSPMSIVPWSSATPEPFVTPAPTNAPAANGCKVEDVSASAGLGGASGSMLGWVLLWNTSREPCALTGQLSVAIFDGPGHRLKIKGIPDPDPVAGPIVLPASQSAPVLGRDPQAGLASVEFQWSNWCATPPRGPLSLAITLPEGGVLDTPVVEIGSEAPRCDVSSADSTVSIGPLGVTPGPAPSDPPPVPAEALRVALVVADHATAGQTLHYVAILTNPTSNPIALSPCPAYQERINAAGGGVVADYVLDCSPAPTIGAGASVSFAMELAVPASLQAFDGAALVWTLDPYVSEGGAPRPPNVKLPIRIVEP